MLRGLGVWWFEGVGIWSLGPVGLQLRAEGHAACSRLLV